MNGHHRRVLISNTHTTPIENPRAIVVYPKFGRMFWTDWSETNPRIMTAWMDGQNIRPVIHGHNRVSWPNGITIDEQHDRLYWTDGRLHRISYVNFDGTGYHVLIHDSVRLPHPYALSIYKDTVYFTDWAREAVLMTNKYTGQSVVTLISGINRVMDLKVMHLASQQGVSPCRVTTACISLCLERPVNDSVPLPLHYTCLCSDSFPIKQVMGNNSENCLCYDGERLNQTTGMCTTSNSSCNETEFMCMNNRCIPTRWHCDRDNDCGDMSDETNCRRLISFAPCCLSSLSCVNEYLAIQSGGCI
ncbi:Low-density lipoprotein receptor-related protein 2 [Lamellibrachia satsuma]|nr:Low-density lipoprotein receptor-related protein 2 [Lamellibrachia satsuma]